MAALRLIFMGTPDLAAETLRALIHSRQFQIVAAVCQPDQPRGRGLKLQPPPVKQTALQERIAVLQPDQARDERFVEELRALQPDVIAVAAYGQILPKSILDLPRYGCVNLHASLLPRYRGAAPIQRAILHGDAETGVTIMKMDEGLDTGAILAQEAIPISRSDNGQTLHDRLGRIGAALLVNTIPEYAAGRVSPRAQPAEGASYAPKIRKHEGRIDWHQPAEAVRNRVRAMIPWPGAFTSLPKPATRPLLKIWEAETVDDNGPPGGVLSAGNHGLVVACGSGALQILSVQREGGKRMNTREFLAGHPIEPGQTFM